MENSKKLNRLKSILLGFVVTFALGSTVWVTTASGNQTAGNSLKNNPGSKICYFFYLPRDGYTTIDCMGCSPEPDHQGDGLPYACGGLIQ